jgi:orotidine-5'-phosphate decarboxylase
VSKLGATRLGTCGLSGIGAVVAATKPADASELRRRMPSTIFLVPGYGAQGGTLEDIKNLWRSSGGKKNPASTSGVLITASRSVIYAFGPQDEDWTQGVGKAAERLRGELST